MILVVAGVFHRCLNNSNPQVLLFQRGKEDTGAGKFEFPGGKVEKGESDKQALMRELEEEIAIKVAVKEYLGSTEFQSPSGHQFKLKVYFVEGAIEQIQLLEHQQMKWVDRRTLVNDEMAEGDKPLMQACFDQLDKYYGKN
jgi:mutator protein MutT